MHEWSIHIQQYDIILIDVGLQTEAWQEFPGDLSDPDPVHPDALIPSASISVTEGRPLVVT